MSPETPPKPEPAPDDRTPLNNPDQIASWLIGDSAGVSPDEAGKLLAGNPQLRAPVADRLFVHGLLRSHYDLAAGSRSREARVARVVTGLAAPAEIVPVAHSSGPARPLIYRFLKPALAAAAVLGAVGLGMFGLPDQSPRPGGTGPREASAAEIVERAARTVDSEDADREYRISVFDENDAEFRTQRLFVRGKRWAMKLDERAAAWVGFDGTKDWMATAHGRTPPEWALRSRTGYVRGLLNISEIQNDGLSGMIAELAKNAAVRVGGRGEAPGKPGTDCVHVWGERGGMMHRIDIWADAATGVPQRVEVLVRPPPAGFRPPAAPAGRPAPPFRARRMVFDYQGDARLDAGFYTEAGPRKL